MFSLHFASQKRHCASLLAFFLLLTVSHSMASNGPVYVDASASGANNGQSWQDAFTQLYIALDSARSCGADTILVAEGTYTPDPIRNSPDSSFHLIDGVVMIGGYASGGASRNYQVHLTQLSGDIGAVGQSFDNSQQVVIGTNLSRNTVLDGFVVRDGYGFGSYENGGGMFLRDADPLIRNCFFLSNSAIFGGGVYIREDSRPAFVNCVWRDNLAASNGGGLFNRNSTPTLFNCLFERNFAQTDGGGMAGGESPALIVNCTFLTNTAFIDGGGMYNDTCHVRVINCTFNGNSCFSKGGAMFNLDSNPFIGNCIFWGDQNGFGNEIDDFASATYIFNSIIQGGYVTPSGVGVNISTQDPQFVAAPSDIRLSATSPARNFGYFQFVPPDSLDVNENGNRVEKVPDFDQSLRVNCGEVDLGAFEFQQSPPSIYLGNDTTICPGDTVSLVADPAQNYPGASFSWSTGSFSPVIDASIPGDYWVTLTDSNCATTDSIRITEYPVAPVSFSGLDQVFCPGDSALFVSTDTIGGNWYFSGQGVNTSGLYVAGPPGLTPIIFHYEDSLSCMAMDTQLSRVLPVIDTYPYLADYENGEDFWYTEGINVSWEFGTPAGITINGAASGDSAWVTRLLGNYSPAERSYLYSPFFNLSTVTNPFVSFQYFNVTEQGQDGAVLQVSRNGQVWENVDFNFTGENWFDAAGIVSMPGGATNNGGLGWSGTSGGWVPGKIRLDSLANETKVQFRLAFSADIPNVLEGFAFDDFEVKGRNRTLLLEQFSHASVPLDTAGNAWVNELANQNDQDVVAIHYHISQSGLQDDPLYLDNPADVVSRTNLYNVTSAPYSIVDGGSFQGASYETPTGYFGWGQPDIDVQVMDIAPFEIEILDLTVDQTADTLGCSARFSYTGNTIFTDSVRFYYVVVERNIPVSQLSGVVNPETNFEWVMKKMLPGPGGIPIFGNWNPGSSLDFAVNWELNQVYDPYELGIIVFAQNPVTQEVYQAAYLKNDLVMGREQGEIDQVHLVCYPVPANDKINVRVKGETIRGVQLLNQLGQTIYQMPAQDLLAGASGGKVEIPVEALPQGVYLVQVQLNSGRKTVRKVVVTH